MSAVAYDHGMDIQLHIDIAAAADKVWVTLGERFMLVGEWAAPISQSCAIGGGAPGVGSVRECHTVGVGPVPPGTVSERLAEFAPERHVLAYEAVSGMPGFVRSADNRWWIEPLDVANCRVHMHATFALAGIATLLTWPMRWQMRREGGRVLEDLKHFVEHGRAHPRKLVQANPWLPVPE